LFVGDFVIVTPHVSIFIPKNLICQGQS